MYSLVFIAVTLCILRLRREMDERLRKEEEERVARRKRVEAIMLRTRGKGSTPSNTPTKVLTFIFLSLSFSAVCSWRIVASLYLHSDVLDYWNSFLSAEIQNYAEKFPNQWKAFFSIDRRERNSEFFPSNTASYGHPQNGNVGLKEQNLSIMDRHPRGTILSVTRLLSYGECFSIIFSTHYLQLEQYFEQCEKPIGTAFLSVAFFGRRSVVSH